MAQVLDMTKFTFNGDVLRSVSELIFDEVVKGPEMSLIHTIYPNIVTQSQIGFVTGGGLVGLKGNGCNPTSQNWSIGTRAVTFTPVQWEILIAQCWTDLEASAAVYSLHKGISIADFTDTDYMTILMEVLLNSMNQFLYRLAWFNSTDAANIGSGSGTITTGVDVGYFSMLDGFFQQMEAQTALNTNQLVTITENQGATYADQAAMTGESALAYFNAAYAAAPIQLKSLSNKFFLVTQSVYDAYKKALQSISIESTYQNLVNGMEALSFNGIPVIAMPIWDEIITSYMNDTANGRYINPHRIVFTAPEVLALGVDDPAAFDTMESWYNKDTYEVKVKATGKADAKLANPALFVYGV